MTQIYAPTHTAQATFPFKIFAICTLVLAIAVAIDVTFFAQGQSFKREGGGLETMSAVYYQVAAIVFFAILPKAQWRRLWHIPTLMVFFAMRELDFDKAFTPSGILSSGLYKDDNPLGTKLIAFTIGLFFLYLLWRTARVGSPALLVGLRQRATWAYLAGTSVTLVFVAKFVDGLALNMRTLNVVVPIDVTAVTATIEEVSEAFIPILVILALVARWKEHPA